MKTANQIGMEILQKEISIMESKIEQKKRAILDIEIKRGYRLFTKNELIKFCEEHNIRKKNNEKRGQMIGGDFFWLYTFNDGEDLVIGGYSNNDKYRGKTLENLPVKIDKDWGKVLVRNDINGSDYFAS